MALHAAQQDNVFKTRIADRLVIVFHSWLQMFHFSTEGFGIHSLSRFKLFFGDCPTVLFSSFFFPVLTALTTSRGQPHLAKVI